MDIDPALAGAVIALASLCGGAVTWWSSRRVRSLTEDGVALGLYNDVLALLKDAHVTQAEMTREQGQMREELAACVRARNEGRLERADDKLERANDRVVIASLQREVVRLQVQVGVIGVTPAEVPS